MTQQLGLGARRDGSWLSALIEEGPGFIAVARGPDHIFEFANRAYYRLVGNRSIIGLPVREAIPEVVDQGVIGVLDRVLKTGEPFVGDGIPITLARAGGSEVRRFCDFAYHPITEPNGTRSGVVCYGIDVTDRQNAVRAVELNEARLRSLVEGIAQIVWRMGTDGRFIDVSQWCALSGQTADCFQNGGWKTVVHPDDTASVATLFARGLDDAPMAAIEFRLRLRDGTYHWFSGQSVPVRRPDGSIREWVGLCTDIDTARRTQDALRESEERFRELAQHIGAAFWMVEAQDHRLLYVSPEFEKIWGGPASQLQTAPALEVSTLHPDDRVRVAARWAEPTTEPFAIEYRIVRPSGEVRWIYDRVFPVRDDSGTVYRLAGIAEDATDWHQMDEQLRSAEHRFRSIMEHSADLVTVVDTELIVQYMSPSYTHGLGYPTNALVGRSALAIVHPSDVPETQDRLAELSLVPGGTAQLRLRAQHANGEWRTLDLVAKNLLDEPAVRGIVVSGRDITERQQLESQLRQAQKMEAVGQLAGGVSHDFNNVLTVILSSVVFALEGLETPAEVDRAALRDDLLEVKSAAERAAALTRQLLAFSRRQIIQPRVLDFNEVMYGLQKMLQRLIGEDIDLRVLGAADLWRVRADAGQLEQVIINLALNARDAMPNGGPLVITTQNATLDAAFVHDHPGSSPGEFALLAVTDTGTGMDDQVKARVFEPFFTTKSPGKGTGLGLAMVYGAIKQSGGYIDILSAPGQGTTLRIYLPRYAGAGAGAATTTEITPARPTPRGTETILVVEDDVAVRATTVRLLRSQGYVVLQAETGAEAMALVHGGEPIHLVLTDVVMPQMGGLELIKALGVLSERTTVLFMSGYTADEVIQRGALPSGTRFLGKPFRPQGLYEAVRSALDANAYAP